MDNIQLTELAQRAISGDMSAFEKIYIELSPAVMSIAAEITHDDEDASDLMQDCFVAALEKIGTLKNPEKLKSWLMRIAVNKSHDYIKKKKPVVLSEEKYELIDNVEEKAIDFIPDSSYEHNERIEEVRKILDSLSEDKRLCLLMHYKYDMNYAEIADELGITVGAVKSKIFRAKNDIEKEAEKRKKKGMPLFGVAPFGLAVTALIKSADTSAAAFAGSAAQSAAFSGISVAAASSAAAAGTAASVAGAGAAGASAVSGAVTAGTSIGTKIAALSVAQKVIAGVSAAAVITGSGVGVATVVKTNSEKEYETTACLEQTSVAFDYLDEDSAFIEIFESTTVKETSTTAFAENSQTVRNVVTSKSTSVSFSASSANTVTSEKATKSISKVTEKSTTKRKETTVSSTTVTATKPATTVTAKKETTTKPKTTTSTAKNETTTKADITKKETTTKQKATTTTKKETTTKANTTKKETETTAETASKATVVVTLYAEGSDETTTKSLSFEAGESISEDDIEERMMSDYGIDIICDGFSETVKAGASYSVDAIII